MKPFPNVGYETPTCNIFAVCAALSTNFRLLQAIFLTFAAELAKPELRRFLPTVSVFTAKMQLKVLPGTFRTRRFRRTTLLFPPMPNCVRVIDGCNQMANTVKVKLRRSCTRESKQLLRSTYNSTHPKRASQAKKPVND